MLLKFICCDVFARVACALSASSPHVVDVDFVPMLEHNEPRKLNKILQDKIDAIKTSGRKYDAVVLGFGLCGNAVIGLSCPVPMVIPRAHDCCTVHMGSREKFLAAFEGLLSARWCSTGYYERCNMINRNYFGTEQLSTYKTSAEYMSYVEKYGEDNADYIWQSLHPPIETDEAVYIKIDGFEHSGAFENYGAEIAKTDKKLKIVDGDISMLRALLDGDWDEDRFLTVPPNKKIAGVYDLRYVMEAGE